MHVGNLRTAWISHFLAKKRNEPWVVRFEDIDQPRVVDGAQAQQLADLAALGLVPDRVEIQSEHLDFHRIAFERARAEGLLYACDCSRKDLRDALAEVASAPQSVRPVDPQVPVYSGRCRYRDRSEALSREHPTLAWRFRMPTEDGSRDFVAARTSSVDPAREFVPAYHWACALDDGRGHYSLIVRAWDLESALEPQRAIHAWANTHAYPEVFHTALVTTDEGTRLEKRTRGITLPELAAQSLGPDALSRRFEARFNPSAEPRTMTLSDLLRGGPR